MSVQLLDKTRKISHLLYNNSTRRIIFNDICKVLTQTMESNVLVISRKGKILGASKAQGITALTQMVADQVGAYIDPVLNERFLAILSTKENVNLQMLGFTGDEISRYQAIVSPIEFAGERLGSVFLYRMENPYDIDDIILSEYGTTVIGLEMMRVEREESEEETRKNQVVRSAFHTLSVSEQEAIVHVIDELDGEEGILVASRIADRVGITRSVIVNALRKFESAGVIQSKSSGMKGTYVKVMNDALYTQIEDFRRQGKN